MSKAGLKGIDNIKKALEKYKGSGKTSFFALEDDGDTAKVRFLNGGEDDLNTMLVHRVKLNGKFRYVSCTGDEETCPLCIAARAGRKEEISFAQIKMFLYCIDRRDGEVKLWERGRKGIPDILGLVQRYGELSNRDYEIVRHGKKKDPETTYQLFPLDKKVQRDLPEMPVVAGEKAFVLDMDEAKMQTIVDGTYDTATAAATGTTAQADAGEDVF